MLKQPSVVFVSENLIYVQHIVFYKLSILSWWKNFIVFTLHKDIAHVVNWRLSCAHKIYQSLRRHYLCWYWVCFDIYLIGWTEPSGLNLTVWPLDLFIYFFALSFEYKRRLHICIRWLKSLAGIQGWPMRSPSCQNGWKFLELETFMAINGWRVLPWTWSNEKGKIFQIISLL